MSDMVVIGSINVDLVTIAKKRPKNGETIMGTGFEIVCGGKGANQAIAAARLGAKVSMIGCVGNDEYGLMSINNLKANGVFLNCVEQVTHEPTGIANIVLAKNDNSIIVVPGANYSVSIDLIKKNRDLILNSKIVVLQLEIPIEVVAYVINLCYENNITTILNPAPAQQLTEKVIEKVTYITPNTHEAKEIFNIEDIDRALTKHPNKLIITVGDKGVRYYDGKEIINVPSQKVKVVDTTGAGDTFNGAFAYALLNDYKLIKAIKFANKVAAFSVTRLGAQGGMPNLEQVTDFESINKES